MKKIKLCYSKINNVGDLLSPMIVSGLFNLKYKHSNLYMADLIAVGSGLNGLLVSNQFFRRLAQNFFKLRNKQLNVWGTGFIEKPKHNSRLFKKNIKFHSVRGELSKNALKEITGEELDIKTGDLGLLISDLVKNDNIKEYDLGIIPHFREQDDEVFKRIKLKIKNSIIIDLKGEPFEVIRQIKACKTVISSSLHGLIMADSYNIPSIHIIVSNKLKGDGFKFQDYYSSFPVNHNYITKNNINELTIDYIIGKYSITNEMIENKKRDIYESFPYINR